MSAWQVCQKKAHAGASTSPQVSTWQVVVHPPHEWDTRWQLAHGFVLSTHHALETEPWASYYKHEANLHLEDAT